MVGDYDVATSGAGTTGPSPSHPHPPPRIERGKTVMTTDRRLRKKRAGRAGGLMCFAGITRPGDGRTVDRTRHGAVWSASIDGDTLVVRYQGGNRIPSGSSEWTRPNRSTPPQPVEHFGLEASAFTKARLDGQTVRTRQWIRTGDTVDAYGRLLRLVYLDGGELFNATLIREGYGHAIRGFDYSVRPEFIALENQARIQGGAYGRRVRPGYAEHEMLGASPSGWPRSAPSRAIRARDIHESAASAGQRLCMADSQRRCRAREPRLGGCANRVLAPTGVSVRFRRCAACRWRGTVARRTSPARPGTRSAGSVSRRALCRAGLSPPPAWLSPSRRVCLCRLAL